MGKKISHLQIILHCYLIQIQCLTAWMQTDRYLVCNLSDNVINKNNSVSKIVNLTLSDKTYSVRSFLILTKCLTANLKQVILSYK